MNKSESKVCKYCSSEISKTASVCPKCQKDLRNWFVRHYIITSFIILIVIWSIMQWAEDSYNKTINEVKNNEVQDINKIEVKEEIIKISSTELYNIYTENEINADNLYKNKILEISWITDSIWKDILDNPYIALKTWDYIFTVQCMLRDWNQASQLKKWENIVVIWKNSWKLWNILVKDCYIK